METATVAKVLVAARLENLEDVSRQRLVGNPEHGGEQMIDAL